MATAAAAEGTTAAAEGAKALGDSTTTPGATLVVSSLDAASLIVVPTRTTPGDTPGRPVTEEVASRVQDATVNTGTPTLSRGASLGAQQSTPGLGSQVQGVIGDGGTRQADGAGHNHHGQAEQSATARADQADALSPAGRSPKPDRAVVECKDSDDDEWAAELDDSDVATASSSSSFWAEANINVDEGLSIQRDEAPVPAKQTAALDAQMIADEAFARQLQLEIEDAQGGQAGGAPSSARPMLPSLQALTFRPDLTQEALDKLEEEQLNAALLESREQAAPITFGSQGLQYVGRHKLPLGDMQRFYEGSKMGDNLQQVLPRFTHIRRVKATQLSSSRLRVC